MRALLQRVEHACVSIEGRVHGRIGEGLLVFLGIKREDVEKDAFDLANKVSNLRIFEQEGVKRSLKLLQKEVLVVSQFTLYAQNRKGHTLSFMQAAKKEVAQPLYDTFLDTLGNLLGKQKVQNGIFGEMMSVSLKNQGPYTILLET